MCADVNSVLKRSALQIIGSRDVVQCSEVNLIVG